MKVVFTFGLIFYSSLALAEMDRKGNGGDAVVCEKSVQVLDVYEAVSLRNFKLNLGSENLGVDEKVAFGIARLKKVDPYRAALLKILTQSFARDTKFIRGGDLRDVEDSDEIFLPTGCSRKQLAIQNARVVFSDPFYTVNEDLWDRLDNDNKAALILHEIIYRASKYAWGSPTVRLFNSMAFSDFLDTKTKLEFYEYVHGTPLKDTINAGEAEDGLWYYQMPDIRPTFDHFWDAEAWDLSAAQKSWDYMCRMKFMGRSIRSDELPQIYQVIKNQYDWGNLTSPSPYRSIVAMDHGRLALYSMSYSGKILKVNRPAQNKGEIWCTGNQFPIQ